MTSAMTTAETSYPRSLFGASTVLGYPRIGSRRELKWALEKYWAGRIAAEELARTAAELRAEAWQNLRKAGIESIPSNVFSYYDHMLDAAIAVDAIPARFRRLDGLSDLDRYFAMARGAGEAAPLELTKWFNTNYHHLVPEIAPDTVFAARPDKPLAEYTEAAAAGIVTRPVLIGPATFLLLSKAADGAPAGFRPFDRLGDLVEVYAQLLSALAAAGVEWVQLDEPAYVCDRSPQEYDALRATYQYLGGLTRRPQLFVATYFGDPGDALAALLATPVEAIGLDLVAAPTIVDRLVESGPLPGRTIVAGLVDGRNVWRTDLRQAVATATTLRGLADHVTVSSSCSLLHVPVDLAAETGLDPALASRLAFARQKVDEVVRLATALRTDEASLPEPPAPPPAAWRDDTVRSRVTELRNQADGRSPYPERVAAQADLDLPVLPTTTIGSFPQTGQLRKARADLRAGRIDQAAYEEQIRAEIRRVIELQERLGLDVLVHGEPERNDMVQYFGSSWAASPPPWRGGSSRTVPAVCGLRSSTVTSAARHR